MTSQMLVQFHIWKLMLNASKTNPVQNHRLFSAQEVFIFTTWKSKMLRQTQQLLGGIPSLTNPGGRRLGTILWVIALQPGDSGPLVSNGMGLGEDTVNNPEPDQYHFQQHVRWTWFLYVLKIYVRWDPPFLSTFVFWIPQNLTSHADG